MRPPWVITSNRLFRELYAELREGDLILVRLNLKHTEDYVFVDLYARKVEAFPSLLAQAVSRSKAFQATVLSEFMPPLTTVVRDRHDLIRALISYEEAGVEEVVTKEDRLNCGLGIHLWRSVEEVYNFAGREPLRYPFVLQPRFREVRDIRVVILGDYIEAYARKNPKHLRNNLFFGGKTQRHELTAEELEFCRRVMERALMPYAHIDMVYTEAGGPFLWEVNLRGGLKGALITQEEYERKVEDLKQSFLKRWLEKHPEAVIL